ncbi:hypothetical protein J4Q44_G00135060 [Coregonus suidteri]|uniref:Uncharacterized protein n=1 Tax=Coregonus suidteri TaxID=861788 RepID=A0AAN8R727_9TELE
MAPCPRVAIVLDIIYFFRSPSRSLSTSPCCPPGLPFGWALCFPFACLLLWSSCLCLSHDWLLLCLFCDWCWLLLCLFCDWCWLLLCLFCDWCWLLLCLFCDWCWLLLCLFCDWCWLLLCLFCDWC